MSHLTSMRKEELQNFPFAKSDVLTAEESKMERIRRIKRAVTLGNIFRGKVKIVFRDEQGERKAVETTIWSDGDKYIMLKGGVAIPIRAIEEIEF